MLGLIWDWRDIESESELCQVPPDAGIKPIWNGRDGARLTGAERSMIQLKPNVNNLRNQIRENSTKQNVEDHGAVSSSSAWIDMAALICHVRLYIFTSQRISTAITITTSQVAVSMHLDSDLSPFQWRNLSTLYPASAEHATQVPDSHQLLTDKKTAAYCSQPRDFSRTIDGN